MGETLVVDIEADGLLPEATTLWQISVIDANTEELTSYNDHDGALHGRSLSDGLRRVCSADTLIMHHGLGYDLPALKKLRGLDIPWKRVVDTLVLSKLGNPTREGGHSLEAWAPRLGYDIEKVQHEDWSRWSFKMEHRCNIDCEITLGVYKRLVGMYDVMPDAVATEHAVANAVHHVMQRGFKLDKEHAIKLLNELQTEVEEIAEDIRQSFPPVLVPKSKSAPEKTLKVVNKNHPLKGLLEPGVPFCPVEVQEFNPGSRQQIADRLIWRYKWKPTKFTPGGSPEVSEDILKELPYDEAQKCAEYLKVDKMIGQINSAPNANGYGGGWLHHVQDDGRVHASLDYNRANTHRLSCSAPNLQQVSRDKRMRAAWVPEEGWKLLGVDAEGLELRCLAHYLFPADGGEYAKILVEGEKDKGTDVHSVAMRLICFNDRDQTKRAEYGWLYGAGDAKLGLIAWQDAYKAGVEINYAGLGLEVRGKKKPSMTVVGKAVRDRLENGFTGLAELVNGIKRKAHQTGKLKGLDGRPLWVRSPHSALNLLLQSAGIIVIKKAWSMLDDDLAKVGFEYGKDYAMVLQVHDEFQFEVRPEIAEEVGEVISNTIVAAGTALGFRCPLAADYKIGAAWSETH